MKRQSYFFIIALFTAILTLTIVSCDPEEPTPPPTPPDDTTAVAPVLEIINEGDIVVDPNGANLEIRYEITNEVENGQISASLSEGSEWITELNYDIKGIVTFTAAANETDAQRTSTLTVSYTYEGGEVSDEINIVQDALPGEEPGNYDYEFDLGILTGTWYGTMYGLNGEDNYYVWLSDKEFLDGYTQEYGTYYLFDMYAGAPRDPESPMPPTGTYTLGQPGLTDNMTFTPDYSKGVSYGAYTETDVEVIFSVTFTEGTLVVSSEDNVTYTFDAKLTDNEGKTHHITYTGTYVCEAYEDPVVEAPMIDFDIDFEAAIAAAVYSYDDGLGTMEVTMQFTDMEVDYEGYVVPPGTLLNVDAFMPMDENGYIAAGTYEISDVPGDNFTLYYGDLFDLFGMAFPLGTYATYYADAQDYGSYGIISEGTMVVTGSDGYYDIECDFRTADGYTIACTYSGYLTVQGIPSGEGDGYSTLTDDYTLDLSNAVGKAIHYGDYYSTGGTNWMINLLPSDGITGDGLQIDMVSTTVDIYSDGVPTGTYVASPTMYPEAGEYLTGYTDYTSIYGTNFVGGFDAEGYVSEFAPATEGDLNITNHGDGTYTISFSFLDDMGHTWDGEWTGEIDLSDGNSSYATRAAADVKRNIPTARERANIAMNNDMVLKVLHKDTGRASAKKNIK